MSVDLSKPVRFKVSKHRFYPSIGTEDDFWVRGVFANEALGKWEASCQQIANLENIPKLPEPGLIAIRMYSTTLSSWCVKRIGEPDKDTVYVQVSRTESGQTVVEVVK